MGKDSVMGDFRYAFRGCFQLRNVRFYIKNSQPTHAEIAEEQSGSEGSDTECKAIEGSLVCNPLLLQHRNARGFVRLLTKGMERVFVKYAKPQLNAAGTAVVDKRVVFTSRYL